MLTFHALDAGKIRVSRCKPHQSTEGHHRVVETNGGHGILKNPVELPADTTTISGQLRVRNGVNILHHLTPHFLGKLLCHGSLGEIEGEEIRACHGGTSFPLHCGDHTPGSPGCRMGTTGAGRWGGGVCRE